MGGSEPRSWVGIHSGGNGEPLLVLEARNAVLVCTVEKEFWRQEEEEGFVLTSLVSAPLLSERPLSRASLRRPLPSLFPSIPGSWPHC